MGIFHRDNLIDKVKYLKNPNINILTTDFYDFEAYSLTK